MDTQNSLTQPELVEKQRRQKDRLKAMIGFMVIIAGVMYGLTFTHL
ncbi:hypothetical protein [Acetobacter indonesiensis]